MKYKLFLDESGNTGNPKLKENGWNFREQPNYALGSICVKSDMSDKLSDDVLELFSRYDSGLGVQKELKSTTNYWFNNDLLLELMNLLNRFDVKFFFDITNKKFNIIKYITHYCIYPMFIMDFDQEISEERINVATSAYNNIDDDLLSEFIELSLKDTDEPNLREGYISFLSKLHLSTSDKLLMKRLSESIDYFRDTDNELKYMIPIEDYTNKGKLMRLLPNIDSFNNVITSTATLRLNPKDELFVLHDIQEQFGQSYENWIDKNQLLGVNNIKDIKFVESKEVVLIQVIDFITGNLLKLYNSVLNNSGIKKSDRIMGEILSTAIGNTNIVSNGYEQNKFFELFSKKYSRAPLPRFPNLNFS